ncbi:molybdopterin-guanine dinucleotide biosynthesis protein B [Methylonatrum kenyense]|uniref:molybdopterin-guanine dinucleotide biosynthesis protein B n=1 Tax=Methylonatrum kenyense TaxID=455253 RepID=UPI0020C14BE6|nr:molybdopterin-guanine dinucleotide biosynthesis protein B [Methylonatrum kenyense]MCK8514887.1 molybdopterin-guanine dinucleotide biosynthesis protein B [Methylonatrum kenyense]
MLRDIELSTERHRAAVPEWPVNIGSRCPLLGFAGWSGAGKTTLLAKLLPPLRQSGLRIAVIKHAHHRFDVDYPGKDSHVLRGAGAGQILISSGHRRVLIQEKATEKDPQLIEELALLDQDELDLILVEGFRDEPIPKLEVYRRELARGFRFPRDPAVLALATDTPPPGGGRDITALDLNDVDGVLGFVRTLCRVQRAIL